MYNPIATDVVKRNPHTPDPPLNTAFSNILHKNRILATQLLNLSDYSSLRSL